MENISSKVMFVELLQKLLLSSDIDSDFIINLRRLRAIVVCKSCNSLPDSLLVVSRSPDQDSGESGLTICSNCAEKEHPDNTYINEKTLNCFLSTYKSFCEFLLISDDIENPDAQLFDIIQESSMNREQASDPETDEISVCNESDESIWITKEEDEDHIEEIIPITVTNNNCESEYILQNDDTSDDNHNLPLSPPITSHFQPIKIWSENNVINSTIQIVDVTSSLSNSSNDSGFTTPNQFNTIPNTGFSNRPMFSIVGTVVRADETKGPVKKLKVRLPKRGGCRCGISSSSPGKLTCCGQRCPCYAIEQKGCDKNLCKCKGCRNPHVVGGKKILHNNTIIDTSNTNIVTVLPPLSAIKSPTHNFGTSFNSAYPIAKFAGFSAPILSVFPQSKLSSA